MPWRRNDQHLGDQPARAALEERRLDLPTERRLLKQTILAEKLAEVHFGPSSVVADHLGRGHAAHAAGDIERKAVGIAIEKSRGELVAGSGSVDRQHRIDRNGYRIAGLDKAVEGLPGLFLQASWRGGVSVADCIRNGEALAHRIAAQEAPTQPETVARAPEAAQG